jgi:hypothetical protein
MAAAIGVGALGFALFRAGLNALFADALIWFEFWEEATELLFVAATMFTLWQFRDSILARTPMLEMCGIGRQSRAGRGGES